MKLASLRAVPSKLYTTHNILQTRRFFGVKLGIDPRLKKIEPEVPYERKNYVASHQIPLTEAFPGSPPWNSAIHVDKTSTPNQETKITKLRNGVTIASIEEGIASATAAVNVTVAAGQQNEDATNFGVSKLIERMSFQSNQALASKDIVHRFEAIGGQISSTSGREYLSYGADVLKEHVGEALEMLSGIVMKPLYTIEELDGQKKTIKQDLEEQDLHPERFMQTILVNERSHEVAFGGVGIGNPSITIDTLAGLTSQKLKDFHSRFFTPERVVIGTFGMPHKEVVEYAEKHFGSYRSSGIVPNVQSTYVGGDSREAERPTSSKVSSIIPQDRPVTHLYIGFEGPSNMQIKECYAAAILQSLLGGGGAFSSGGPGKGMYSRLYTNVLNGNYFVESCHAMYVPFDSTGLFGIYSTFEHGSHMETLNQVLDELVDVSRNTTERELMRAKNQLKSTIFGTLESRSAQAEDAARQVIVYGKHYTTSFISEMINSVTLTDMVQTLNKMLRSKPTIVSYGHGVDEIPPSTVIQSSLRRIIH